MALNPVKTPFIKMSYTPDVPPAALGPNEYNIGQNVETDVRGIKKVAGEELILNQIPGNPIFMTSGFRLNNVFWFIVCCDDGNWFGVTTSGITVLTPLVPEYDGSQYTASTAITAAWNGDVLFLNDTINPPMYLLPDKTEIRLYDSAYLDQTPNTYVWNYSTASGWTNLVAGFQRVYAAPNVGSVLVAGNISYTISSTVYTNPNTVRWSQAFGLNSGPTSWEPTVNNIANEVDMPVRGPLIDGFALNGNFYLFSYWDCCIMTPIAYQSTNAPVFGISPVTNGRGILNENCYAINDSQAYGLDSSDIWVLNNGAFTEIGNQRVKNWFYDNLNPAYYERVHMVNNTKKNQIEIYFPDLDSTGPCNKMLGYRYDLDIWNPPRSVHNGVMAVEAPIYNTLTNTFNISNRGIVYAQTGTYTNLIQKDVGTGFFNGSTQTSIDSYFRRDNISYGQPYSSEVQIHRVFPEVQGQGQFTVSVGGSPSVGATATIHTTSTISISTSTPWVQAKQNKNRVNTVIFSSNDSSGTWIVTQANWQVTITEDDR